MSTLNVREMVCMKVKQKMNFDVENGFAIYKSALHSTRD